MLPLSLAKAMTEPVKVIAPMATPSDISTSEAPWIVPGLADAEGGRRVERRRGDEDGGKADAGMEGGDELRHRRHGDAPGDHRADAAADAEAEEHQEPAGEAGGRRDGEGGEDGERHAGHAEIVAAPRGLRRGQAAQRHDEQDAGDEVEQLDEIDRHRPRSSMRLGGGRLGALLGPVHCEHALGHQEAAEDVDRGEHQGKEAERARPEPGRESSASAVDTPTARSAPTTMTEEMALVTDISGVCSAGVTDQTT